MLRIIGAALRPYYVVCPDRAEFDSSPKNKSWACPVTTDAKRRYLNRSLGGRQEFPGMLVTGKMCGSEPDKPEMVSPKDGQHDIYPWEWEPFSYCVQMVPAELALGGYLVAY
ncbi:hypothetical protein [Pseudomonas mosselii]|uniref:Uncharacterized protein n=1 Tax=Pseudomonas mosselii TaxID=78327 RepID=A0AA42UU18_9PSED|nr:hypothetical protein [Pseudomonas mosselii]MDH1633175.1 hypothetical protein [Pseudomonas mosselii]